MSLENEWQNWNSRLLREVINSDNENRKYIFINLYRDRLLHDGIRVSNGVQNQYMAMVVC